MGEYSVNCLRSLAKMRGTILVLLSLTLPTIHFAASESATEKEEDYIDLFGSTNPKAEVEDTTTPPPFWTSDNEYDKVDMALKREIFGMFKMVYPTVILIAGGIIGLCILVPIAASILSDWREWESMEPREWENECY